MPSQKGEMFFENIINATEKKEITQKQSSWIDSCIETLKDKDIGSLMGGVSTDKPLNWDADGTSKLTQEQIDYLRSTYDLSDMSKQDYYDLMADLTNMNAISIKDVISQYVKPIVPGVVVGSASQERSGDFGQFNKYGNLQGNLLQYLKDLNYMSEWLKNGHSTMDSSTFFAFKDYLNDEKALAGRLESIFDLIA
jgi:hypothetical protein